MKKTGLKFLEDYLNNSSPTGHEAPGQKMWVDYIEPFVDEWHLDSYGTAYGIINPKAEYRVVIEAHADEISWMVNYISDDGFIFVLRNGGMDNMIAPSKRVNIHTSKGLVRGVFGWPAIHTRRTKDVEPAATVENLFIDIGAKNKEEVHKMGIHIGAIVTYDEKAEILNKKYLVGRALDNRTGGYCIAEVARKIKEKKIKLPYALYIVNAVQEEIGLRGAQMIAERIKPHAAIITDVTHDTHTPHVNVKIEGDVYLGKGPAITYAPAVHNKLLNMIITAAEKEKIPIQRCAASRSTGTDTDSFAYSNHGVPSALISLPLRYMHTTVEMAHLDDLENVTNLMVASLKQIPAGENFKYF